MDKQYMQSLFGGVIEPCVDDPFISKQNNMLDCKNRVDYTENSNIFYFIPYQYKEDMKLISLMQEKGIPFTADDWYSKKPLIDIAQKKINTYLLYRSKQGAV